MSRAVVVDAILDSTALSTLGFDETSVLPNFDGDQRPAGAGDFKMFMVIRWGVDDAPPWPAFGAPNGPKHFDIWVHMPRELSTDYLHIDGVIDILDSIFSDIIDTPGDDGYTLTLIEPEGRSRDLRDDGYQTLCRQVSYRMLSRLTPKQPVPVPDPTP